MRLPAPVASTIRLGLMVDPTIMGAIMPAAVSPATVADPRQTRIKAAMIQAARMGCRWSPCISWVSCVAVPLSVSVLTESGTATQLTQLMKGLHLHPILAAWIIAAFIRVCLGSATVAGLTAAGMIAPMIVGTTINPSLIVLATGAGSLMFSHVNDSGFWLFKEYFNLSVKETLKTWSVMESIVSIVGLLMVGLLYFITHH